MRFAAWLVAVAMAASIGCSKNKEIQRILDSPIEYDSHLSPWTNLDDYTTWGWVPVPEGNITDPRASDPALRRQIETEVGKHMSIRGYRQANSPDLLVNYHVITQDINEDYIKRMYDGTYLPEYRLDFTGSSKARSEFYLWLGEAYAQKINTVNILKKKGIAKKIKENFVKAVELDPESADARWSMADFYMIAPGIAGGSKEKAREHIDKLKRLDPKRGRYFDAHYYTNEKKYDSAEREYLEVIELYPADANVYYRLGRLYQESEQSDKAFESFEKALAMDPDDMNTMYQIGRTGVFAENNLDRAVECVQMFLQREPDESTPSRADARWRLGMLYRVEGNKDMAKLEYQAALELEPDHKQAKKSLKKLRNEGRSHK